MMKYKTQKIWGILAIMCCLLQTAKAQQTQKLSLNEAIQLSLKNSHQLKIDEQAVNIAAANLQAATDARLPNLAASGGYLRLSNANINIKSSGNNGNGNGEQGASPSQALYGMVNLSMPIYAGGKIKYGIESARYLEQAAKLDAENDKSGVAFTTTQAYVNLFKAQQSVQIIRNNLNASMSRDSTFGNLERNGLLARNDLLKSQLQTANTELALLDAQSNASLAMANMDIMLGQPSTEVIVIDTSFLLASDQLKTLPDYLDIAATNRKDLQAIQLRKQAAASGIKSAKAEAYPALALTGGYVAADIPKVLTITNAVNFGLGIQYNIGNLWKKNTRLMEAKARQAQAEASESLLNDGITLRVNTDYEAALLSLQKIKVFEKAVAQAEENYRITNNKYNNSLATITELLEANAALLQSQLNIQLARADAALAYHKLLNTVGTPNY